MPGLLVDLSHVLLHGRRYYVRFDARNCHVLDVTTGRSCEDVPTVEFTWLKGERRAVSVGAEQHLRGANTEVVNPFGHPRLVVHDIDLAAGLLRHLIGKISGRWPMLRPDIVMHPMRVFDGGLTDVERGALLRVARDAMAMRAAVHVGDVLGRDQLLNLACERVFDLED